MARRHNLDDPNEAYQSFVIDTVASHPRHRGNINAVDPYDVAIVKLFGQLDVEPGEEQTRIISINRDNNLPRKSERGLTILGWGLTTPPESEDDDFFPPSIPGETVDNSISATLQEATVFYIPNDVCQAITETYQDTTFDYRELVADSTLCAANFVDRSDACQGDSGSPILQQTSPDEDFEVVGVTAAGFGCAHKSLPAFYVRTSNIQDWIDEQVCRLSEHPPDDGFSCDRFKLDYRMNSNDEAEALLCLSVPITSNYLESASRTSDCTTTDQAGDDRWVTLRLEFWLDQHPNQQGWVLQSDSFVFDNDGNIEERRQTLIQRPIFAYADREPNSRITEYLQVTNNDRFILTILDSEGNGQLSPTNPISRSLPPVAPAMFFVDQGSEPPEKVKLQLDEEWSQYRQQYRFTVGNPSDIAKMQPKGQSEDPCDFISLVLTVKISWLGQASPEGTGLVLETEHAENPRRFGMIHAIYAGSYSDGDSLLQQGHVIEKLPLRIPANELSSSSLKKKYRLTIFDDEASTDIKYQAWLGGETSGRLVASGRQFYLEDISIFELTENDLDLLLETQEFEDCWWASSSEATPGFSFWKLTAIILSLVLMILTIP